MVVSVKVKCGGHIAMFEGAAIASTPVFNHIVIALLDKEETIMRAMLAISLATLAVAPAAAQFTTCTPSGPFVQCNSTDGSMTNCNRTGTIVNCNTIGGGGMAIPPPDNGGALRGMVNAIREVHHRKVMAKLATAIQTGDCPTALILAANSDDVQTMITVRQFCDSRPATSVPVVAAQPARPMSSYEAGRLAAQQQSRDQH